MRKSEPKILNPALVKVTRGDREFNNIEAIELYSASAAEYWRIRFKDGSERTYSFAELEIVHSCRRDAIIENCLEYLRQIASINGLKSDDDGSLLQKQYEKLDFVGTDTAMAVYLNPENYKAHVVSVNSFIFPFGGKNGVDRFQQ